MTTQSGKVDHQPGYILMSQPWKETSLLIEVFTFNYGRLSLVARSARRPQSVLRGVLMPFAPLNLSWFGQGELKTLHSADWLGGIPQLSGIALLSGFYINELLLRLTIRDEPIPSLFTAYETMVYSLANSVQLSVALRRFELALLAALGYAPTFDVDIAGNPVLHDHYYRCFPGQMPQLVIETDEDVISGNCLLAIAADDFSLIQTRQFARKILNQWLTQLLPDGRFLTSSLLVDAGLKK